MQLRDVVNSTYNLHANWTGPPCNDENQSRWAGVGCSEWHVTHLVVQGIELTGSLPSMFLQNLTFLTKLSFRNNSLHGPLPSLTNLLHLEFVFLSRNQFSGSIPSGYIDLPRLTKLELQENDLSGQIPPFDQQSLIAFNVSNNKLEGPIPRTPVLQRFPKSSYDNNFRFVWGDSRVKPLCNFSSSSSSRHCTCSFCVSIKKGRSRCPQIVEHCSSCSRRCGCSCVCHTDVSLLLYKSLRGKNKEATGTDRYNALEIWHMAQFY